MKKLLFTILALAAVSGAFARRRCGGGSCKPCKPVCATKCAPCAPRCAMPAAPKGGCLPNAQCSDSCAKFKTVVPCEAWAVVEAKQAVDGCTNVVTSTTYTFDGCPYVDESCLSRDKIRLGEGVYNEGGCK